MIVEGGHLGRGAVGDEDARLELLAHRQGELSFAFLLQAPEFAGKARQPRPRLLAGRIRDPAAGRLLGAGHLLFERIPPDRHPLFDGSDAARHRLGGALAVQALRVAAQGAADVVRQRDQRGDVAGEAHRVAEQVVQVDAALVAEVVGPVMVAGGRGEDGGVELAGEEIGDHRFLEEGGAAREVLHVAEQVAHAQRVRAPVQERPLLDAEEIEAAVLVLRLDAGLALLTGAVEQRELGQIEDLLQRRVHGQHRDRGAVRLLHVGVGEERRIVLAPFLAGPRDGLERRLGFLVARGLGGSLGARLHLLAAIRRGKHALEPARSEDLRGRQRVEGERRLAGGLGEPQHVEQVGPQRGERERPLRAAEGVLRIVQLGADVGGDLLDRRALQHLVRVQVDARDRLGKRKPVGVAGASRQMAQAAHPGERTGRRLHQHAGRRLEGARLARGQPGSDEEARGDRAVEDPVGGLADGDLAEQTLHSAGQLPQCEHRQVRGRLVAVGGCRLGDRAPEQRVDGADQHAARPARGDPGGEQPGVERRMQLGGLDEGAAHVLPLHRGGRREGDGAHRLRVEAVEEDEVVELVLLEERAMPQGEQEEEIAHLHGPPSRMPAARTARWRPARASRRARCRGGSAGTARRAGERPAGRGRRRACAGGARATRARRRKARSHCSSRRT